MENKLVSNKEDYRNVVCLMSGGIDSSMAAHVICLHHSCSIWPLYIRRGASAEKYELIALKKILTWLRTRHDKRIRRLRIIECYYPVQSLRNKFPKKIQKDCGYIGREIILAYIGIFYAINLSQGRNRKIAVVTGSLHEDLFPHNSIDFWSQFNKLTKIEMGIHAIPVLNPLQFGYSISPADKRKIILFAKKEGFPIRIARSCISSEEHPCGRCQECFQRSLAEED